MFDSRLVLDQHVLGYWGFDEANVLDPALDETALACDLAVANAASVVPARRGNGRQFNGTSTAATLANPGANVLFRQNQTLTIICWVTLDSVLQTGSQRRTIVCCDGDGGPNGRALYDLHVTNDGRVVYEHQNDDGAIVRWQTAPSTLRTSRYYSVSLVRDLAVFHMDDDDVGRVYPVVTLRLNNEVVPWETISSGGVPLADITAAALPAIIDGTDDQTFKVGHSGRRLDAFWHGVVDELSVHYAARKAQPYLDAAYNRVALTTAFNRLTSQGDIRTIGSVEMGGGTRWWCYERDKSLFVIRENSLGLFEKEILLTTTGTDPGQTWFTPGGVEHPKLAYDPGTDTLLVVFVSAGKVYKITAKSSDSASTQNMPAATYSAHPNAGGTSKLAVSDAADSFRLTAGEAPSRLNDPLHDGSTAPSLTYFDYPEFGVVVIGSNPYGYAIYRVVGGSDVYIGKVTAMQTVRPYAGAYWWFPLGEAGRFTGVSYRARPLTRFGTPAMLAISSPDIDFLGRLRKTDDGLNWRRGYDAPVERLGTFGGETAQDVPFSFVNRSPIKPQMTESVVALNGGEIAGDVGPFGFVNRSPIKPQMSETLTGFVQGGAGLALSIRGPGGLVSL